MKTIELKKVEHTVKIGDKCPYIEPNVTEDCLFVEGDEVVGFYISEMPKKMCELANLANAEFRSNNVPKSEMSRGPQGNKKQKAERAKNGVELVTQFSTILGGVPPKPHMRRPYPTVSSVHSVKTAKNFIKAMLLLAKESEKLIKEVTPEQYDKQKELLDQVPDQYKFANLFTSSISNFNISAQFHRDTGNIVGASNVIICKKNNSKGGDLNIPDYGATIGQKDNSILVYPAWRNIHGVTPITPTHEGGYRNSLVFYPLNAFCNL